MKSLGERLLELRERYVASRDDHMLYVASDHDEWVAVVVDNNEWPSIHGTYLQKVW